jgi:pimeloyl-ACP methyl ester carboxylesterase
MKELDYESLLEARAAGDMGDIPLIVITADRHFPSPPEDPFEARRRRRLERQWIEAQEQLARLSSRGVQLVLRDTGHNIQRERPGVIIDAVREVVLQARAVQ